MKKYILLILCLIFAMSSCLINPVPAPTPVPTPIPIIYQTPVLPLRPFVETHEFTQWLETINDYSTLLAFIKNECRYVSDNDASEWDIPLSDYWQTPVEFFENCKGDCEDFHYFISYVSLRRLSPYRTWVVVAFVYYLSHISSHAYSVIEVVPNKYITINYDFISSPVDSIYKTINQIPGGLLITNVLEVFLQPSESDMRQYK